MFAARLRERANAGIDPQTFVEGLQPARKRSLVQLEQSRGTSFQTWSDPARGNDPIRVSGFGSPLTNSAGRIDLRWEPGSTIPFGVGLKLATPQNPPRDLKVELWTNINSDDPTHFYGLPMNSVRPGDGADLAFNIDAPVPRTGTYAATVRISTDGGQSWQTGGDLGVNDVVFRANSKEFEGLNIKQILIGQANATPDDWRASTIEDLLDNKFGNYNLASLQEQGVNCIYIECPFRSDPWDNRHPADTLGSPFAVTDYFAIDPRWSREAREIPGWDRDRQMAAANGAFKRLTDEAHNRGMKVIVGVAPNHVGHNYTFRDMFETDRGLEVMRNNFSQIAVNQDQLNHVANMLKSDKVQQHEKQYAEYLFPWMYATRDDRPEGARSVNETMSEWWYGDWNDIKKLNHGGHMAVGHKNGNSPQQRKTREWIARWMSHAATHLGVDGFRLDHSNGMAENFLNETITSAQRITDKHLGYHKPLFMMPEDHDRKEWTSKRVDLIQSEWWHDLISACAKGNPNLFFSTIQNPYFYEVKATDTHDTGRGVNAFGGDLKAYGRYIITTMLSGGAFTMMMGSEYGEGQRTNFKAKEHVPTLLQARQGKLADANIELNRWVSVAGRAKTNNPALKTRHLQRMEPEVLNDWTARTVAFAKHPDNERDNRVLVYSNLANKDHQGGYFRLDEGTRTWLDGRNRASGGNARFQVKNLMGGDPNRGVWDQPKTAGELIKRGVFVDLNPYQVQALELYQV